MRHVTLKQLRLLSAAARTGSFAAAAEACGVTAPAVTMQMKNLEAEVGLPLFERDTRGLHLTAAGEELAACARRIDIAMSDCDSAVKALKSLEGGRVVLGVVSTAKYFAPFALAAFARQHPGVETELVIGNRGEIVAKFEDGALDVTVMGRPPEHMAVESALIGEHPHLIVAAPDHPLVGRGSLKPADLVPYPMLTREAGSGTRTLMEQYFREAHVSPRIGMEIGSNETIKQAVMAGLGLAVISGHTVATELADGRLVSLPVDGVPLWRKWFVVRPQAKRLMPAARALRDYLATDGHRFLPKVELPQVDLPNVDLPKPVVGSRT
ncbi:LysR family transcriptional regulator [Blastochloris sulfoviridis]|uniref:HTH-type transcriptional regulator CbbR n=1 Tax=Blastochloris sulfoviridis TaxID=50712 RepID=A0A5M6I4A6_9HYPH|nr:LysR family transcriptional regulator [Blastochloris sulfoviridis]KAA5603056.1 LysR family transcriptional regulator [Blastochloris sulfoviridis]